MVKKGSRDNDGRYEYANKDASVFNLEYAKGNSKKLFHIMYYRGNVLFLKRKYDKIKIVFKHDAQLHPGQG